MISNVNKLKKYSCLREWVQIRQNYFGHWSRLEISSTWRFRQKQCNQFATMQILIFDNESFFSHIFFPQPTLVVSAGQATEYGPSPGPSPTCSALNFGKYRLGENLKAPHVSGGKHFQLRPLTALLSFVDRRSYGTPLCHIYIFNSTRPAASALLTHTNTDTLSLTHPHTHTPLEWVKLFPSVGCHDPPPHSCPPDEKQLDEELLNCSTCTNPFKIKACSSSWTPVKCVSVPLSHIRWSGAHTI